MTVGTGSTAMRETRMCIFCNEDVNNDCFHGRCGHMGMYGNVLRIRVRRTQEICPIQRTYRAEARSSWKGLFFFQEARPFQVQEREQAEAQTG